jgi:hypothetical protein
LQSAAAVQQRQRRKQRDAAAAEALLLPALGSGSGCLRARLPFALLVYDATFYLYVFVVECTLWFALSE